MNGKKLRDKQIYDEFRIPPSRANIRVEGPVPTSIEIKSGFLKAGLTAADLVPIDWRKKIAISPVKNQQSCGDCWAMSSTSALTDRFIAQKGIQNLVLEHALTAQCVNAGPNNSPDAGCEGGQPFFAGQFFENYGVPSSEGSCPTWEKLCGGTGCELPRCDELKRACKDNTLYKAKKGSTKNLAAQSGNGFDRNLTVANIKKELLNGPVVACYFVPPDFMASVFYKWEATNGIYVNGQYGSDLDSKAPAKFKARFNNPIGEQWGIVDPGSAHAVEVVGWATGDAGKKLGKIAYWIVKNSWGPDWNEHGYFRIAMSDTGLNTNIGFDVPVMVQGQQFGGMVSWDPLLDGVPSGPVPQPNPKPTPPGPGSDEANQNKARTTKRILLAVGIILLVCILSVGGYYMYQKHKSRGIMNIYKPNYPTNQLV